MMCSSSSAVLKLSEQFRDEILQYRLVSVHCLDIYKTYPGMREHLTQGRTQTHGAESLQQGQWISAQTALQPFRQMAAGSSPV